MQDEYKYQDLTHSIIGCAMEVHKVFGNGFQEVVYQRALAIEMNLQNISFVREMEMRYFIKAMKLEQEELIFLQRVK